MGVTRLPHEGVFVRLGISEIDGIGVFAIRAIPAGTNIFANDAVPLVWIDVADLEAAESTQAERELYRDFGIKRGTTIGCPVTFNNLTPGWYLNQPPEDDEPCVEVDTSLNFVARRDIAAGEEITIRYQDFSDATG